MHRERWLLLAAGVLVVAGLGVVLHGRWIEASGVVQPLALSAPASDEAGFRPHWSRTHFVLLRLSNREEGGQFACLDDDGFFPLDFDLRWWVDDGHAIVASGSAPHRAHRWADHDHQTLILGSFAATPRRQYTLHVDVGAVCPGLASLDPRLEVSLRPGPPYFAYSLVGTGLLGLGAVLLFVFALREDKSWPWLPLLRRAARCRWVWLRRRAERVLVEVGVDPGHG